MEWNANVVALGALILIHVYANQIKSLGWIWHGWFLSFAAGISFAYVFIDLLPTLEKDQPILEQSISHFVPYLDRHTYVIALLGFLFYYGIDKHSQSRTRLFWISLAGYLIFNFLVGLSLADKNNSEIQPIALYTFALGMHYFVKDHMMEKQNSLLYKHQARWLLAGFLLAGYLMGFFISIPSALIALVDSFLAGGIILNVLHYELPKRDKPGYGSFVLGALSYAAILLSLHQ